MSECSCGRGKLYSIVTRRRSVMDKITSVEFAIKRNTYALCRVENREK